MTVQNKKRIRLKRTTVLFLLCGVFVVVSGCIAQHHRIPKPWVELYANRLHVVNGLEVFSGENGKRLLEIKNRAEVIKFLNLIEFDKSACKETMNLSEAAQLTFCLVKDEDIMVSFDLVSGKYLRPIMGLWPKETVLTEKSTDRLENWLKERGIELEKSSN